MDTALNKWEYSIFLDFGKQVDPLSSPIKSSSLEYLSNETIYLSMKEQPVNLFTGFQVVIIKVSKVLK